MAKHDIKGDRLQINRILSEEQEKIVSENHLSYPGEKTLDDFDLVYKKYVDTLFSNFAGGANFLGHFLTLAELNDVPVEDIPEGSFAYVGTGDEFTAYYWDNVGQVWGTNQPGFTNFAADRFYKGNLSVPPNPSNEVLYTRGPKDVIFEDTGNVIINPAFMGNFVFVRSSVNLQGVYTANIGGGQEFTVENRTGAPMTIEANFAGPANTAFNMPSNITLQNGEKAAFKSEVGLWANANVTQVAFSDTLDSVNSIWSVGPDGLDVITGIVDINTGEEVQFKEYVGIPSFVDGVVYVQIGAVYFKRDAPNGVNALWYAKGDGIADDTAALNAAFLNQDVFLPRASYRTTGTVNIPTTIRNLNMISAISLDSLENIPVLEIGQAGATVSNANLTIQASRASQSDWTSEDSIGIKIINANTCRINIISAQRSTIGVRCIGDNGGFSYNEVTLGLLRGNKISFDLCSNSTNGTGWANENNFYGGRFAQFSGTKIGEGRIGVRIKALDGSYTNNNNNIFHKPSFELLDADAGAALATPIVIEHGLNNEFKSIRNEANSTSTAIIWNTSTENKISVGYGSVSIQDNSTYPYTKSVNPRTELTDTSQNIIFNSGPLHKKANYYDGGSQVYVPGLRVIASSGSFVKTTTSVLNPEYIELQGSRAVGIYVDTRKLKRFVLRRDVMAGYGGRMFIKAFDDSGAVVADAVRGAIYNIISYVPDEYGGISREGGDRTADSYFAVNSDVRYVFVGLVGGTTALRLRSFSIASVDGGCPSVWSGLSTDLPLATTPPTLGTNGVGSVLYNDVPANGSPKGWVCTTGGTPGTWMPFGEINTDIGIRKAGSTAQRPISPRTGFPYFDTDIDTDIWWDGSAWKRSNPGPSYLQNIKFEAENTGSGGRDLNLITDSGIYYNSSSGGNFPNAPDLGWWFVEIIKADANDYLLQRATNRTDGTAYYRTYTGSAWTAWKKLNTTTSITTFLGLTDTPALYTGQAKKIPAVNATENGLEFINAPVGIVAKGVSTSGVGFYTPPTTDNYLTPVEVFRNSPFSWLAGYYEIGRILEVNLSGTASIPATQSASFSINIGGTRYCPIEIDGLYSDNWSIRYLITVTSSTSIRISGLINGKNISDANSTNESVAMDVSKDITIDVAFSSNDVSNEVTSNLIYVNVI